MLHNGELARFIKAVTARPALLNARGPEGSTPFMYAALYTNAATLDRLLKLGADPNAHNDANATALMWAAHDLAKTAVLVAHHADVNVRSDDFRTALMVAARQPTGTPIHILWRQGPNGEWKYPLADTRQPLCLDHIGNTAMSIKALETYAPKSEAATYRRSVRLAGEWLATAQSYNNDDRSWRVAGLAWANTSKSATHSAVVDLLATQKPDGSWSDLPTMDGSAYATGKSLVALHIAGVPAFDPAYKHGVDWLLANQQQDGSWYVQTRAFGFQPWSDAGFPHHYDQFISAAGTNWVAMALTYALPDAKAQVASRLP